MRSSWTGLAMVLALAGVGVATATAAAATCDRACLIKATDAYLAAVAAHDPAKAPLAPDVAFVENLKRLKPGEGLWKTETGGPTAFAIYVPDPQLQQAGWMGVVQQDGKPVMLALRLRLKDGRITEAEHLVAPPMRDGIEHLGSVRPRLVAEIADGQRLPHDRLIGIGASYYDALDDNDGSKSPLAQDCQRRENGMTTAGEGANAAPADASNRSPIAHDCKGQIDSQSFIYIDRIVNRRMVAADTQTGLVMGLSHFHMPMDNLPYKVRHVDGSTSERNKQNFTNAPFDMPAAHIFKVGPEGEIHEIEAVGPIMPYNSPTGW